MRALIFATRPGGGHDAAARAIQQALEAYGVEHRSWTVWPLAVRGFPEWYLMAT